MSHRVSQLRQLGRNAKNRAATPSEPNTNTITCSVTVIPFFPARALGSHQRVCQPSRNHLQGADFFLSIPSGFDRSSLHLPAELVRVGINAVPSDLPRFIPHYAVGLARALVHVFFWSASLVLAFWSHTGHHQNPFPLLDWRKRARGWFSMKKFDEGSLLAGVKLLMCLYLLGSHACESVCNRARSTTLRLPYGHKPLLWLNLDTFSLQALIVRLHHRAPFSQGHLLLALPD